MEAIKQMLDGRKFNGLMLIGLVVVLIEGGMGMDIPGVVYEPMSATWMSDAWLMLAGIAGRSAIAKIS